MEKRHQGIIVALHIFSVSLSLSVVLIFKPQEVGLSFSPSTSYKHNSTSLSVRLAFDLDSSDKFVNCKFSRARTTDLHTLACIIMYICLPEKCMTFRSWSCRDPSVTFSDRFLKLVACPNMTLLTKTGPQTILLKNNSVVFQHKCWPISNQNSNENKVVTKEQ